MVELFVTDFLLIGTEAQRVHHFLQIEVFLTDVEAQLVHDHLHLVLELLPVAFTVEEALENGVHEDLVPRDTVCLLELEAPPQKILGFGGEAFSSYIERLFFDVSHELQFCIGSPGGVSV